MGNESDGTKNPRYEKPEDRPKPSPSLTPVGDTSEIVDTIDARLGMSKLGMSIEEVTVKAIDVEPVADRMVAGKDGAKPMSLFEDEVETRKIGKVDVVVGEKEVIHRDKLTGLKDYTLTLETVNPKVHVVEWVTVENADRGWEVAAVFSIRSEAEEFKKTAGTDKAILGTIIQHLRMSTVIDMIANCKMMGVPAKIDELIALQGKK